MPDKSKSVKIRIFIGIILCAIISWIGTKIVVSLKPYRINKFCKNKLKTWILLYDIIWGLAIIKYNKQKNIFRVLNFVPKEPNSVKISSFIGRILCAIIGWNWSKNGRFLWNLIELINIVKIS